MSHPRLTIIASSTSTTARDRTDRLTELFRHYQYVAEELRVAGVPSHVREGVEQLVDEALKLLNETAIDLAHARIERASLRLL